MHYLYNPRVPYQFKRVPLSQDEATRLGNAGQSQREKLVVWTLLDEQLALHGTAAPGAPLYPGLGRVTG
jgi:hypothetical protein